MIEKPVRAKAGIVPARRRDSGTELLLISARSVPESWIFPTGTVESGESLAQTATRECREETGYEVTIGPQLGVVHLDKGQSLHRLVFFLGEVTAEVADWERDRRRRWVTPAEAVAQVAGPFRSIAEAAYRLLTNS